MSVTCPLCRQSVPEVETLEDLPPTPTPDPRTDLMVQVLRSRPRTARQVAAWLAGDPRPVPAEVERARRLLDRAVRTGAAVRTVGRQGLTDRPLVTYSLPTE